MNHEEMLSRLNAGEKPIDVAIAKWQNGKDERCFSNLTSGTNCGLCESTRKSPGTISSFENRRAIPYVWLP